MTRTKEAQQEKQREQIIAFVKDLAATAEAAMEERRQLQEWPPIQPAPPYPEGGKAPKLPKIREPTMDNLYDRFLDVLKTHEDPEIHNDLYRMFVNKEIGLIVEPTLGPAVFAFAVAPRDMLPPDLRDRVQPGEVYPVMISSPMNLGKADILEYMMTVSHEYVHYKEWRDSGRDDLFLGGDGVVPEDFCEKNWHGERAAYYRTCELAAKWDRLDNMNGICRRMTDAKAFDQALFVQTLPGGLRGDEIERCVPVWAKLAGHPHPEAFK